MALKQIKNKIIATEKTGKVTKAMEAVSAVKMRKSQERALSGRPFAEAAFRILDKVAKSTDVRMHDIMKEQSGEKACIVVVTSDKGLAGNLNSGVLKTADELLKTYGRDSDVVCFGRKAYEHFMSRGYNVPLHHVNISDEISIEDMKEVSEYVLEEFTDETYHTVYVVFQNFVSTFEQTPSAYQVLPINRDHIRKMVKHITPKKGLHSEEQLVDKEIPYTTEDDSFAVYDAIFNTLVEVMFYHALLENKACEHSARMVAMKNATDKSKEMVRDLTLLFNKERQAAITAEVSEITGGIEAMK